MIKFQLNQIDIPVFSSYITERLRELISQDKEFEREIEDQVFGYLVNNNLYDIEDGWHGEEPDRIVVNIPLPVYPVRNRD